MECGYSSNMIYIGTVSVFLKKKTCSVFFLKTCFFKKKTLLKKNKGQNVFFFKTTCFQGKYSQFVTVC